MSIAEKTQKPLGVETAQYDQSFQSQNLNLKTIFSQIMIMGWRSIIIMLRKPEQFFDAILQPVLFTLMFGYIFGGAVSGTVDAYLVGFVPAFVMLNVLTASHTTGVALREDMDKGVVDRFKSLPIARIVPLAGPMMGDLPRYFCAGSFTLIVGVAMGYRPESGIWGALAMIFLGVIAGWSIGWLFAWIGTVARSAQAATSFAILVLFPGTFLSNAFVPTETMPNWLQWFVRANPISHLVAAARDLGDSVTMTSQIAWALGGCFIIVAIFAPLSVYSYRRVS